MPSQKGCVNTIISTLGSFQLIPKVYALLNLLRGMKGLRASGTVTPGSGSLSWVWFYSSSTHITLVTAHMVPFSMWRYSVAWFIFLVIRPYQTLSLRAW